MQGHHHAEPSVLDGNPITNEVTGISVTVEQEVQEGFDPRFILVMRYVYLKKPRPIIMRALALHLEILVAWQAYQNAARRTTLQNLNIHETRITVQCCHGFSAQSTCESGDYRITMTAIKSE